MAISIITQTELANQTVSSAKSYKYLFEPLRIRISESGASYIKIKIIQKSVVDNIVIKTLTDYYFSETDALGGAAVDLMELIRDFSREYYRIGSFADIALNSDVLTNLTYDFRITTNLTTTEKSLQVIPIIGGRSFDQFTGDVLHTSPLTEWQYYGLEQPQFNGYQYITVALQDPNSSNLLPDVTLSNPYQGRDACGGYLVWKSRFGGWMHYGFDIFSENENMEYKSEIESAQFQSSGNRIPYVPTDYAQISTSYSVSLKALSVSKEEAQCLRGLNSSPAVYLMRSTTSKLELMRLTGASIPINNLANGVDVSVSLSSISQSIQNAR